MNRPGKSLHRIRQRLRDGSYRSLRPEIVEARAILLRYRRRRDELRAAVEERRP